MSQRVYTVYLSSGGSFTLRAARFEKTDRGIVFYDEADRPLEDTYVDPAAVVAVIPPGPQPSPGSFPTVRAGG